MRGDLPWGKFHRLLEHLPEFGRYKLAVADDDELAAAILAHRRNAPAPTGSGRRVPLMSWTEQRELAATLTDLLTSLRLQILAGQLPRGKKPPKVPPAARPRTALQRVEARSDLARHRLIVSQVLPRGEGS